MSTIGSQLSDENLPANIMVVSGNSSAIGLLPKISTLVPTAELLLEALAE